MSDINRATLGGRLGADPELTTTSTGKSVCNMMIATTEYWTNKATGQAEEETLWHRVVAWNKDAENCAKYLRKGDQAFFDGKMRPHYYEKDGEKRKSNELVARTVSFGRKKGDNSFSANSSDYPNERQGSDDANVPVGYA